MEVQHNKTSPVGFNQLAQESFFYSNVANILQSTVLSTVFTTN